MKILGIDPGTALLGWGLIDFDIKGARPLKYGCIETGSSVPMPQRLAKIYRELSDIIERDQPDEVAIEELFYFKNAKTVIAVAQARGVAIICAENMGLPVYEYTPLQVKQAITGYGRADKKQMQEMIRITCKLDHCPKPDDAADALAVAICHAQSNKLASNGMR